MPESSEAPWASEQVHSKPLALTLASKKYKFAESDNKTISLGASMLLPICGSVQVLQQSNQAAHWRNACETQWKSARRLSHREFRTRLRTGSAQSFRTRLRTRGFEKPKFVLSVEHSTYCFLMIWQGAVIWQGITMFNKTDSALAWRVLIK